MKLLKTNLLKTLSPLLLLLGFLGLALPAQANGFPYPDDDEDKKEEAEHDEDEEEDDWLAIVGGDVHTGNGGILRGATILAKNGKIEEIGHDLYLPEGTEKVDARGMRVYPGLVALSATTRISRGLFATDTEEPTGLDPHDPHFGIDDLRGDDTYERPDAHVEVDEVEEYGEDPGEGGDQLEDTDDTQAAEGGERRFEEEDSYDPFSQNLILALSTGITSAQQSNTAMKLRRDGIDDVAMSEKTMSPVSWSIGSPSSIRSTREKFERASEYVRELREWEDKKDKGDEKEPSKKGVDTTALKILKGEVFARFNANGREDLLGIARLAQQYHFRPVIFGCLEGWTVADELGRAGAFAVITPRTRRAKSETLVRPGGSSIENAAILHRAGVQIAIVPGNTSFELSGMTGRDLLHLPTEAGFAIRGGLPEEAAFDAITTVPARLLGISHRVGTIEVGKDCDVIVTDGDILHYQTFVQLAVVAGKLAYDKQEEIFFAHIRPRPELPPLDPGEEAMDEEASDAEESGDGEESEDAEEEEEGDEEEPEEEEPEEIEEEEGR